MRENFDFVTMDTYTADMAEQSSHAAGIIRAVKRQQQNAERDLIAAVLAAGGRIEVSARDMVDANTACLKIERRTSDDALILTVIR